MRGGLGYEVEGVVEEGLEHGNAIYLDYFLKTLTI
jgi:hypothetical protein